MKLLFFQWNAYMQKDITHYFKQMKIDFDIVSHNFRSSIEDPYIRARFPERLLREKYDAVFSLNYLAFLADICYQHNIIYISWIYDSPIQYKRIETLMYPTNRAFFFDRQQYSYYRSKGYDTVYYMPLGIPTKRLDQMHLTEADKEQFAADISFVGKIYETQFDEVYSYAGDYEKGYLKALCDAQQRVYGYNFINELLPEQMIRDISASRIISCGGFAGALVREQFYYAMCTKVTQQERIEVLTRLSERYQVDLYSMNPPEHLKALRYKGTVDYETEMPKVFRLSRINLNITLKCIESGIPLRALDILGCGGFLLSNYQPELLEYFADGKEVVCYESMEDLVEKAGYYLSHEEERAEIAKRGHDKAQELFAYPLQLARIFKICGFSMPG